MKKYSVTLREHEEYGEIGIVVDTNRDYFEPSISGLLAAHDILEHTVQPHVDGIIDELMALGSVIAGRIEYGYNTKHQTLSLVDIESEVQLLATSCMYVGDNFCVKECNNKLKDKVLMNNLKKCVRNGLIETISEYNKYNDVEIQEYLNENYNLDHIVGWICKGYQIFKKRFNNIPDYNYIHIFDRIAEVCDNFIQNGFEGQNATLFVNYKEARVWLEVEDGWED